MKINKIGKLVKDTWLTLGVTIFVHCLLEASLSLVFFVEDRFARPILRRLIVASQLIPTRMQVG